MRLVLVTLLFVSASSFALESLDSDGLRDANGDNPAITIQTPEHEHPQTQPDLDDEACKHRLDPTFYKANMLHKASSRAEEDISQVISKNGWIFSSIYRAALKDNPCMQGIIIVTSTLSSDGTVIRVESLSDTPMIEAIAPEIEAAFSEIRFGQGADGEVFDWPLNFLQK